MIVTPVSASPASSARWIGAAPRQRGSSEACTLRQPRRGARRIAGGQDQAVGGDHRSIGAECGECRLLLRRPQGSRDCGRQACVARPAPAPARVAAGGRGRRAAAAGCRRQGCGVRRRSAPSRIVAAKAGVPMKTRSNALLGPVAAIARSPPNAGARRSRGLRLRFALASLRRIIPRLSERQWSTNSTPSRWSISCCRQVARSPLACISRISFS